MRPNLRHHEFLVDRSNGCRDVPYFRFLKMAAGCRLWFLKVRTFFPPVRFGGPKCVIMPNFMPIFKTVAVIWPIFNFSRWHMAIIRFFKTAAVRNLGLLQVGNFNYRSGSEAQYASPSQISWGTGQPIADICPIFDFSRWRPTAILDVVRLFGPPTKCIWWLLSLQNLVGNCALVSVIRKV